MRKCWEVGTMPSMTKSALRVARDALAAGEASLAPYGSRFSRRDYSQPVKRHRNLTLIWSAPLRVDRFRLLF